MKEGEARAHIQYSPFRVVNRLIALHKTMAKFNLSAIMADLRNRIPGFSSNQYASLDTASSTVDIAGDDEPRDTPWGARNRRLLKMATLALAAVLVLYMVFGYG